MSYEPSDAKWDEAYERLAEELYPHHERQAIREFTSGRLKSYYLTHPEVTKAGFAMQAQACDLLQDAHYAAALVFAASAAEQYLRVALLRPVIHGLVHLEPLADLVVEAALTQTGYVRYAKLLAGLFRELTQSDIATITRIGSNSPLLREASELQAKRNDVIHRAEPATEVEAVHALEVSDAVLRHILVPALEALDLQVHSGRVVPRQA